MDFLLANEQRSLIDGATHVSRDVLRPLAQAAHQGSDLQPLRRRWPRTDSSA
jgi:hypothetical protein